MKVKTPLYRIMARALAARISCENTGNTDWQQRHSRKIEYLVRTYLPSGSGIDSAVCFDFDKSTPEKLVLTFSFHHLDQNGAYSGWTDHSVIVTPSLAYGFNLKITGRDKNTVKQYLFDVFGLAFDAEIDDNYQYPEL